MASIFYHNSRCQKSREALKILVDKGENVEVINYLQQPFNFAQLCEIIQKLGIDAENLVRKQESIYKTTYKGKDYSHEEWIELMVKNPQLIERPIFVQGERAVIGRPSEKVLELL